MTSRDVSEKDTGSVSSAQLSASKFVVKEDWGKDQSVSEQEVKRQKNINNQGDGVGAKAPTRSRSKWFTPDTWES